MRTDDVQPIRFIFRRLRSLHVFTWVVALVVSAALVLIMVPGERMYWQDEPDRAWQGVEEEIFEATYASFQEGLTGHETVSPT